MHRIPLLVLIATLWQASAAHAMSSAAIVPPPATDLVAQAPTLQTAVFAGGCFWGVQGVFQHVAGVHSAVSGYAGGQAETATYPRVGSGRTGHAESVRIVFDPKVVTYGQLLQIHFAVAHDPTQRDRQGPDVGPQYRSTVFAMDAEQARIARGYIEQLNRANTFGKALATTVEADKPFYPAESYHQDFMTKNPRHPYIVMHDLPKIAQLKRLFPAAYRAEPVRVAAPI